MLKFTDFAVQDMIDMMEDKNDCMSQKSGYNPSGSLSLSYDPVKETSIDPPENPTRKPTTNTTQGNTYEPNKLLVGSDITAHEPSILHQAEQPTTAKYEFKSCAASSERFTEELAQRCANDPNLDVTFLYNTRVQGVTTSPCNSNEYRVAQLQTNNGVIDVPEDAEVVVAAGAWSPHITALMGLYTPVYPLKGYAMSVSAENVLSTTSLKPQELPSRIVCDKYMYTSRLGKLKLYFFKLLCISNITC